MPSSKFYVTLILAALLFETILMFSFSLAFTQGLFWAEYVFSCFFQQYCKAFLLTLKLVAVPRKRLVTVMFTDDARVWHR